MMFLLEYLWRTKRMLVFPQPGTAWVTFNTGSIEVGSARFDSSRT